MITVQNGKIYVDGLQTTDPELIGFGLLDFIDENEGKVIEVIALDPSHINTVPGFYGAQCTGCDGKFIGKQ